MQLSKIKMSGFKSFVDPTTVPLSSHLVAVVGPNGCGKSNIIDAVTWVMGESSPKYLRGESLTDVIFNGSNARKPVGQASVELVFDNQDGTIGGEYAAFAEISVKRVINRDSDSTYYLNGVRCRKRDVVDLFLGTGLGPRSYSIVGQNMITRMIEAKPEELRGYLEEAAGISKYKERRHETELRIKHTNENLSRVNDLQQELDKQLSHLKHQASVAEKYKTLKEQERVVKAELYTVQWRQLDSRIVDHTLKIQREETGLEAKQSELTSTNRELEQVRHEQRVASDAFQEVQRHYYAISNEITRIEQDITHHEERRVQWESDLAQVETESQGVKQYIVDMDEELQSLEGDLLTLEPELGKAKESVTELQIKLNTAEETLNTWQVRWDDFNQSTAKTSQIIQVERTRIQHLEQRIVGIQSQLDALEEEKSKYVGVDLDDVMLLLNEEKDELSKSMSEIDEKLSQFKQKIVHEQQSLKEMNHQLSDVMTQIQKWEGEKASLEALQQFALGQRDNPSLVWLEKHNLLKVSRLAQEMQVDSGWEFAVEKVLGIALQAVCVDHLNEVALDIESLSEANLCLLTAATDNDHEEKLVTIQNDLLINKIKSHWPLNGLLSKIYTANDLEEALKLRDHFPSDAYTVITKSGIWVGKSWIKILREQDSTVGTLEREQSLKSIQTTIQSLHQNQQDLEEKISQIEQLINQTEEQRDESHTAYQAAQIKCAEINAQVRMHQERQREFHERLLKLDQNCKQLDKQVETLIAEKEDSQSLLEESLVDLESQSSQRERYLSERDSVSELVRTQRETLQSQMNTVHAIEMRHQAAKSQKISTQQALTRFHAQLSALNDKKTTLQSELSSMMSVDSLKKSLARALDKHVASESELNTARISMNSLEEDFKKLEERRAMLDQDIGKIRNRLESLRVEWQGWKTKADTIREQMAETSFTLEEILKTLSQEITPEEWQIKLDQIVQRINRLGPINLVAIDEYATCLERKQHLDKQVQDLQDGLNTLSQAIAKIDSETKIKFKETFDKVNQRFQELFPTIFGGGKAYLELTDDNLLEAGITMMACPPGKRNSHIYLLSGGEKSLTAIALIFSIFHLNPAPFCLLDEVDAALDDANVLRFIRLVQAMSDKTQFIFISHNKITIEVAHHLIGVTMQEPGVSRLVSVDIEKAIEMTEAS